MPSLIPRAFSSSVFPLLQIGPCWHSTSKLGILPTPSGWWKEYSDLLAGAEIMSISFSPLRERQIRILDTLGNIRTAEVSRQAADGTSFSTIFQNEQPLLLSSIASDVESGQQYLGLTLVGGVNEASGLC